MPKRPKCVVLLLLIPPLSHFLFPRDFLGTIAEIDIINTPPESFRPTDVPFRDYETEAEDIGGIFGRKIDYWL